MRTSEATEKRASMADLLKRAEVMAPEVCENGHGLVWGEGPLDARIAIVGEAPGDKEEKLGRPFVGPAGVLLDKELARIGLDRNEIWITNIVKCRPVAQTGGRTTNRPPTAREINSWLGPLMEELEIIQPDVILCAGAVAAKVLIRKDFALSKERGRWFDGQHGARIMATYHPAYLLRLLGQDRDDALAAFRSDLHMAVEALESG